MHIAITYGLPIDPQKDLLYVDASGWLFDKPPLGWVPGQSGLLNDAQLATLDAYEDKLESALPTDRF